MSTFSNRPIAVINSERIELTPTQIQSVYAKVNEHNNGLIGDKNIFEVPHYVIQLTGDKQVYFTLYRFFPPSGNVSANYKPYQYMKNISIDIMKAVETYATGHGLPIQLWADDNFKPIKAYSDDMPIFTFGKYRGCTMEDVFNKDAQYIVWYSKQEPYVSRYGKVSNKDANMKAMAKEYANLYFQTLTEKNREESTSEFVGTIKVRQHMTITIGFMKTYTSEWGDSSIKAFATDENGNHIQFYVNGNLKVEKGNTYNVKATPVKHFESVGKKTTRINRVTIL
jgi:hypothetical protein